MSIIPPQEAEELINKACDAILPPTSGLAEDALLRLAGVMEGDHNSLGQLLDLLDRYLIARHRGEAEELSPAMVIACADHGVTAEGVSAYPPETSVEMARNYVLAQGSAANIFAAYAGAELYAVDMGLHQHEEIPGLADFRLGAGTANIAQGPAMSREQAAQAVAIGIGLAEHLIADGANCLLPGEMGIGNTTSQACLAAVFCGLTPEEATGRGTFQDDTHLANKIRAELKKTIPNSRSLYDSSDPRYYLTTFAISGFLFAILEWMDDGMRIAPEVMADFLTETYLSGASFVKRKQG